jgi:hypothetical protein
MEKMKQRQGQPCTSWAFDPLFAHTIQAIDHRPQATGQPSRGRCGLATVLAGGPAGWGAQ